jgi:zinc transport system ATP-binding protein
VKNLCVTLNGVQVLTNVSCHLETGKLNAVIGPNGAGKTTLLRAILGLVPYTGTIEIGRNARGKPLRVAYVPQRLDFDHGMPMSVLDFMCAALQRRPLWLGHKRAAQGIAEDNLKRVGGSGWKTQMLGRLSGGELQRVLLATALSSNPDVMLLDEPVAGVDIAGEELFCDLLASLQHDSRYTMLLVSHDLSIVTQHAQHVICLNQTVQCQGGTVETLTEDNLRKLYRHDVALYTHGGAHEGHSHHHD